MKRNYNIYRSEQKGEARFGIVFDTKENVDNLCKELSKKYVGHFSYSETFNYPTCQEFLKARNL